MVLQLSAGMLLLVDWSHAPALGLGDGFATSMDCVGDELRWCGLWWSGGCGGLW